LTVIPLVVESKAGFLEDFLGFQPKGRSDFPLYREMSLEHAVCGLSIPLNVGLREEVLEGGFGAPAIVNAKDILIFILNERINNN
jgi:hypothetical protein